MIKKFLFEIESNSEHEGRVRNSCAVIGQSKGHEENEEKAKQAEQTEWRHPLIKQQVGLELPSETIKRLVEKESWRISANSNATNSNQERIRKREQNNSVKANSRCVKVKHSADLYNSEIDSVQKFNSRYLSEKLSKVIMNNQSEADNSSGVSYSTIQDQKRDLEVQITHIQQQLHHLKREGQFRINETTGRILKYRPDKRTRTQID